MTTEPHADQPPLMGLAALMRMAFAGYNLAPLATQLLERHQRSPQDANALLDLATVLELSFKPEAALECQAAALALQPLYHLPSKKPPALRLLAVMAPGEIAGNAPLPFLLEESDVTLDMLYIGPGVPMPEALPEHDVLFVAISESEQNRPLLEDLQAILAEWPRPVLNRPERILATARDAAHALLHDIDGLVMPPALRVERAALARVAADATAPATIAEGCGFPLLIRPVGSHAGHGLERITAADQLAGYLERNADALFFISPFIDYSGPDGQFRKYRVVLVDGRPYAGHMAISSHWMIHYLNAGMDHSAGKRAEEAQFMAEFHTGFARRHGAALAAIHKRLGLDYLVIDCAETAQGELLVFEVDSGAVIHAMDPPEVYPYKGPAMQKIFDAFRALLERAAAGVAGQQGKE